MRRRFPIIVSALFGIGLLAVLFLGSNLLGRNNQQPGQNGTTQQGRNMIGGNMQGANPSAGPNRTNMPGDNRDDRLGKNQPGTQGIYTTPSPDMNMRLNRVGNQISQQTGFDRQKADNIRNRLGNIDGIGQINAVVNGNTALVGYSLSKTAKDANNIKNMITNRVKQIDNTITNVVVSDSADITSGIERLSNSIRNNNPVNDLNNEFNQIIQRIKPAAQ